MEGIQSFKGSWPWPWIRSYGIPSCITHRPLPIYQISLKSKKLFVDGRTDVWTYGRTDIFPPLILLGWLLEVDLKISNESSPPLYNICSVMTIWKLKGEIIRTALYHILWTLISAVPKLIQDQCVLSSSFIFSVRSCFPQEGSFICFGISCVSFMFSLVLGVRLLVPIQLTEWKYSATIWSSQ